MFQIIERNGYTDAENESDRYVDDQVKITYNTDNSKAYWRRRRQKSSKYERKYGYEVGVKQKDVKVAM